MSQSEHTQPIITPTDTSTSQDRRELIQKFGAMAGKVLLGSLPFILFSAPQKAQAQTQLNNIDKLNDFLPLAYLREELYTKALASSNLNVSLDGANRDTIKYLLGVVTAQRKLLVAQVINLGGTPVQPSLIDWTGGSGPNGNGFGLGEIKNNHSPFEDVPALFTMAQMFTDLSVKMYKGGLNALMNNKSLLNIIMRLQSADARMAANLRMIRRKTGWALEPGINLTPWISGKESGATGPYNIYLDAVYSNDDNTIQDQVDLMAHTYYSKPQVSGAFDEGFSKNDVNYVLDNFIV